MPECKLVYLNLRAIAEPIRFIFAYAGIPYEDKRIEFSEWPAIKPTLQFPKVPVLYVDGKPLFQSVAIARFAAKKAGLIPKDDLEAAVCDEVMDTIANVVDLEWRPFVVQKDVEAKALKKISLLALLASSFDRIEQLIKDNGGKFIAGSQLSWADLSVAHYVELFELTIDPDICKIYPNLLKLKETVFQLPQIKKWIDERPEFAMA